MTAEASRDIRVTLAALCAVVCLLSQKLERLLLIHPTLAPQMAGPQLLM